MDKTELEALLARIDIWLLVFGIVVVVGVAGESFFGMRHWWNSRKLQSLQNTENDAQRSEIARLNKEAGDARREAGEAIERAAKTERQAAELNRKAEEERLARVKIEERLAPRRISAEQAAKLSVDLAPLHGQHVSLFIIAGDPETAVFGDLLNTALTGAGLVVQVMPGMIFGQVLPGISLKVGDNRINHATIIANALVDSGLARNPVTADHTGQADELQLVVGPKH